MIQSRPLDLNILPDRYRPRPITFRTVAAVVLAAALVLGLIPAYIALARAQDRTANLKARVAQAEADLAEAQTDPARLEQVEGQIEQLRAQTARIQDEFGAVTQTATTRSHAARAVLLALVPDVRITAFTQDGETCTLTGQAESNHLLLSYARALRSSGQFASVLILSIVNPDPQTPAVEFTIHMEQSL